MTLGEIAQTIQDIPFFTAIRESGMSYPIILSTHLTCIAVFGGLILMSDLRLLGVALTNVPVSEIIRRTRIWKWIGFCIMVTCGILLGGAKFFNYYDNPYFDVKMTLLIMVAVHAIVFRRSVYGNPEKLDGLKTMPREAKMAGLFSMVIWVGILSMGRWIAYFDRPDSHPH